jgi:hypothetical protein
MPNENDNLNSNDQQSRGVRADPVDPSGIVRHSTCWMSPPFGQGEAVQVEAKPEVLVPLMVAGYSQCEPPASREEVKEDVHG